MGEVTTLYGESVDPWWEAGSAYVEVGVLELSDITARIEWANNPEDLRAALADLDNHVASLKARGLIEGGAS